MRSFQISIFLFKDWFFIWFLNYKPIWLYDELILQSALTLNLRSVYSGLSDIFLEEVKNIM